LKTFQEEMREYFKDLLDRSSNIPIDGKFHTILQKYLDQIREYDKKMVGVPFKVPETKEKL